MIDQILVNIQTLVSEGKKCLVVFDLDSTLFDVSPRIERILLDFAALPENQARFPEQVAQFKDIRTHHTDWGITNALQRAGLDGHHPEFQEAVALFWRHNFFSNEYLKYDLPNEGAIDYVHAVANAGGDVAYLTGRDVFRMGPGTLEEIKQWNLPLNDKAELILKPEKSMDDAEFKTDWFLAAQKKGYQKIYFFDNEPVILHLMGKKCPDVESIFFESTHSGKAEPPPDLPRIINFVLNQKGS
ncbi:MAG: HAD family hydrolase [Bdellovibrio sp.]|nr:HAD family hydrolase [Bdellovibrio sp.]